MRRRKQQPELPTVTVPVLRTLAEACQDWSVPVQMRFLQVNGQWQMLLRPVENSALGDAALKAMHKAAAELAIRQ